MTINNYYWLLINIIQSSIQISWLFSCPVKREFNRMIVRGNDLPDFKSRDNPFKIKIHLLRIISYIYIIWWMEGRKDGWWWEWEYISSLNLSIIAHLMVVFRVLFYELQWITTITQIHEWIMDIYIYVCMCVDYKDGL